MEGLEYIRRLKELRQFLYEHPEQRIIYRDINIDLEIMRTKHAMHTVSERDSPEETPETIPVSDDFMPTDENPFAF